MTASPEFIEWVRELLTPVAPVTIRRMFGGAGVFAPGPEKPIMFALIDDDVLYFKVDSATRTAMEEQGAVPFSYSVAGEIQEMPGYFSAPENAMDVPEAVQAWARKALAVALSVAHEAAARKVARKAKARSKPRAATRRPKKP